jgi:hypothetical protein
VSQDLWNDRSGGGPTLRITNTLHSHNIDADSETDLSADIPALTHEFDMKGAGSFGAKAAVQPPAQLQRDGKPEYGFVCDLRVTLDGDNNDITRAILDQLDGRQPGLWKLLGDGRPGHPLASDAGTGEIDLLALGYELGIGAHKLTFHLVVPQSGDPDYDPKNLTRGGQIQYNLYID